MPAKPADLADPDDGVLPCGRCGQPVADAGDWTTWCESCDWNVVTRPEPVRGVVRRWRRRLVDRAGARVHDDLRRGRPPHPADRVARLVLLVLCGVIDLAVLASTGLLVWAVLSPRLGFWHWPVVVAGALWVFVVLPRPLHLGDDVVLVDREQAPGLWALVDEVASGVGTAPPQRLGLSSDFNAFASRSGWRWQRTVVLGLALWAVERPQERVATIAHELGHFSRRDVERGIVVGTAFRAVVQLLNVLWPDALEEQPVDHEYAWLVLLTNGARRLLALPVLGLLYLLDRLSCRSTQRAEYLADLASARVAGSGAASTGLLRLLGLPGIHARAMSAARRREDVWTALAAAPQPPARELRRLLRESELRGHQEDDTHPPTHLRVDLVRAGPAEEAAIVVDAGRRDAIELELGPVREQLRERFTDDLLE